MIAAARGLLIGQLIVTAFGVSLLACSESVPQLAPASAPGSVGVQLNADGLEEGPLDAFGLKLPARSTVKRSTPSTVVVEVPANSKRTLEYLKARLTSPGGESDAKKTVFEQAEFTAAPGKKFRVVVKPTSMTTEVTVRREPEPQPAATAVSIDEASKDPRLSPDVIASVKAADPKAMVLPSHLDETSRLGD